MPPTTPIGSIESANINAMNKEALRSLTSGTGGYNAEDILDFITPTTQDTSSIYETASQANPFLENPIFSSNSTIFDYTKPAIDFNKPYTMSYM